MSRAECEFDTNNLEDLEKTRFLLQAEATELLKIFGAILHKSL